MNKQSTHIIYVPGFGAKFDSFRLWSIRRWKFRNVTAELVPMKWNKGTFEQKMADIDRAIDRARGKRVVLIGESAGGSMVIHAYARRDDIAKVMTICGKNTHPESVDPKYYDDSTAFETSMELLNESLDSLSAEQTSRFVSIHPLYDPLLPVHSTLLPGCRRVWLFAVGHKPAILLALTLFAPIVVRAARQV